MAILPPANGEVAKVISGRRHGFILDQNRDQQPRGRERMPQANPPDAPVSIAADDSEVAPSVNQRAADAVSLESLCGNVNGVPLGDPSKIEAHPGMLQLDAGVVGSKGKAAMGHQAEGCLNLPR